MEAAAAAEFLPLGLQRVGHEGGGMHRRLVAAGAAARTLRAFLRQVPVDVVHAHESAPALVARLATFGMPIARLVTYHGSEPERVAGFGRIARLAATRVIVPSHRVALDLQEKGGVPSGKVLVLGLGVAPGEPAAMEHIEALRRDLLGPDGTTIVLTVARLAHQKGIDVLVAVARKVVAQLGTVRFVVVGDGPLAGEAAHWARVAGVEAEIRFVGHSERVADFMAAADLFLLTSRWEALPITIVEAFHAGLPVVATDVGGVRELVDARVGTIVPAGDVAGLADAVLRIARDDPLRHALGTGARTRASEARFSPPLVHAEFERLYASLARERLRP